MLSAGDRRRFPWYASRRNIKFEIAKPSETYDLVIMTQSGDISVWCNYKKNNSKIIYDFQDSYLSIPKTNIRGLLRGFAKFVSGQNRHIRLNYWKALENMCRKSDAVVCSTEDQKLGILKFCKNVRIILDVQSAVAKKVKTDYSIGTTCNLIWEGLPQTVHFLFEIQNVLECLSKKHKIALHVLTDLEYFKYLNKYVKSETSAITQKIFKNTYLYEWNEELHSSITTGCDIAIIPIPLNDPFCSGKPENKLLLFWRMGIPTITSATPSYQRAMTSAKLNMTCNTQQDWQDMLEKYINSASLREHAGKTGKTYTENQHGEEKTLLAWDKLLDSVLS